MVFIDNWKPLKITIEFYGFYGFMVDNYSTHGVFFYKPTNMSLEATIRWDHHPAARKKNRPPRAAPVCCRLGKSWKKSNGHRLVIKLGHKMLWNCIGSWNVMKLHEMSLSNHGGITDQSITNHQSQVTIQYQPITIRAYEDTNTTCGCKSSNNHKLNSGCNP